MPVAAIGGITLENAPQLIAVGADMLAWSATCSMPWTSARVSRPTAACSPHAGLKGLLEFPIHLQAKNTMTRNEALFSRAQKPFPAVSIPGARLPLGRRRAALSSRAARIASGMPTARPISITSAPGAADPRPRRSGYRVPCRKPQAGVSLRRTDRSRDRTRRAAGCSRAEHGNGALCFLRYRGDHERDPPRARLHRTRRHRQIRRLLPRPTTACWSRPAQAC